MFCPRAVVAHHDPDWHEGGLGWRVLEETPVFRLTNVAEVEVAALGKWAIDTYLVHARGIGDPDAVRRFVNDAREQKMKHRSDSGEVHGEGCAQS